jgi:signal transduction histidine kinase
MTPTPLIWDTVGMEAGHAIATPSDEPVDSSLPTAPPSPVTSAEAVPGLVEQWWQRFSVALRDVRTWRAVGYICASALMSLIWLMVSVAVLVPALALCVVGIGFVLTNGALTVLHRLLGTERRRAAWVGITVHRPILAAGSIFDRFRDGNRWRGAVFALTAWLPTLLIFAGLVVVWGVPLYLLSIPLWGWAIDSFSVLEIMGQALAGAGLMFLAPVPTQWLGCLLGRYVDAQLGPDKLAAMQQRVSEVTESRSEILTAVAGERRRIERNLHDGVQQRLVALGIDLGLAQTKIDSDPQQAQSLIADAIRKTRESIGELRSIGRGLHPAILGDRGLDAALSSLVANATVPVELRADLAMPPPPALSEAAYFVVSEALTNVMKHSQARTAAIDVVSTDDALTVAVYDDGRGGASLSGTGLAGIAARARGLNGSFDLSSPPGGPTTLTVVLPYT